MKKVFSILILLAFSFLLIFGGCSQTKEKLTPEEEKKAEEVAVGAYSVLLHRGDITPDMAGVIGYEGSLTDAEKEQLISDFNAEADKYLSNTYGYADRIKEENKKHLDEIQPPNGGVTVDQAVTATATCSVYKGNERSGNGLDQGATVDIIIRDCGIVVQTADFESDDTQFKLYPMLHEARYIFSMDDEGGDLKVTDYDLADDYVPTELKFPTDYLEHPYYSMLNATYPTYDEAYQAAMSIEISELWPEPIEIPKEVENQE